jgi:hypothetical protein
MGVGIKGAAQCVGNVIMTGIMEHPNHMTVQVDCKIAFNTLWREVLIKNSVKCALQLLWYVM